MKTLYVVRDHEKCVATTCWRLRAVLLAKDTAKKCGLASIASLWKDGEGKKYRRTEAVYSDGKIEQIGEDERI